jgi:hypothetical protein
MRLILLAAVNILVDGTPSPPNKHHQINHQSLEHHHPLMDQPTDLSASPSASLSTTRMEISSHGRSNVATDKPKPEPDKLVEHIQ